MKLPSDVKPRKLVKVLKRGGFLVTHKVGSHVHFHNPDCRRTQVSVHPKPIAKGTLRAILQQTKMTVKELRRLFL